MTRSVEEQMADIERRMKQLRARKQRIVARENAKARKRQIGTASALPSVHPARSQPPRLPSARIPSSRGTEPTST